MIKADFRVVIDACVLANYPVCDLLLRLAEKPRQYLPVWSNKILDEVYGVHTEHLNWPKHLAESFRSELTRHFPEAFSEGYAHLIPHLTNEPKDRHVLAAAIHAKAPVILTFNLKDFPADALDPWQINAYHPQDYLLILYEMDDKQMVARIAAIAAKRGQTIEDVLLHLGTALPIFAHRLLDDLSLG